MWLAGQGGVSASCCSYEVRGRAWPERLRPLGGGLFAQLYHPLWADVKRNLLIGALYEGFEGAQNHLTQFG